MNKKQLVEENELLREKLEEIQSSISELLNDDCEDLEDSDFEDSDSEDFEE